MWVFLGLLCEIKEIEKIAEIIGPQKQSPMVRLDFDTQLITSWLNSVLHLISLIKGNILFYIFLLGLIFILNFRLFWFVVQYPFFHNNKFSLFPIETWQIATVSGIKSPSASLEHLDRFAFFKLSIVNFEKIGNKRRTQRFLIFTYFSNSIDHERAKLKYAFELQIVSKDEILDLNMTFYQPISMKNYIHEMLLK